MKMESSDSFLTDDKFEPETQLFEQNVVDGSQLIDTHVPRYLDKHLFFYYESLL